MSDPRTPDPGARGEPGAGDRARAVPADDEPGRLSTTAGDEPAALSADAGDEPGALSAGAADEPGALSADAGDEPGALSAGAADEPGALSAGAADEPAALSADAADEPGALSADAADEPGASPPAIASPAEDLAPDAPVVAPAPPPPRPELVRPRDAVAAMRIRVPTRGNRRLDSLLAAANGDEQLKAWWHVSQVNAMRLGMSDHSWVHIQIVCNIALRLFRLLLRGGVQPAMVTDYDMRPRDAEVVIVAAGLLHCVGMSVHRGDHEAYSLFLAADKLPSLLADAYEEPERSIVTAEAMHAIIGHRRRGDPLTVEGGIIRVADALDMAKGRSRVPFEAGQTNIHSLSAAAIDEVRIEAGEERAVRIEIAMNNSAGIFQVDELLATKLRGTRLQDHVEVIARIDAEHEKRLVPVFRL
jgi:metal-dependent HD superfamily phosphatase/phosphodiesterase